MAGRFKTAAQRPTISWKSSGVSQAGAAPEAAAAMIWGEMFFRPNQMTRPITPKLTGNEFSTRQASTAESAGNPRLMRRGAATAAGAPKPAAPLQKGPEQKSDEKHLHPFVAAYAGKSPVYGGHAPAFAQGEKKHDGPEHDDEHL